MINKKTIHIAINGLNASSFNPAAGLSIIRAFRESKEYDIKIIGLSNESIDTAIYMHDLVDRSYHIPNPAEGEFRFLKRLDYILSREKIDLLIPCYDKSYLNYVNLKPHFAKRGIYTFLPTIDQYEYLIRFAYYKKNIYASIPNTCIINSIHEIENLKCKLTYPLSVSNLYGDSCIAENENELQRSQNKILHKWGFPVLIREQQKGTEFKILAITDEKGNSPGLISIKKIISTENIAWATISNIRPEIIYLINSFLAKSGWIGPVEFDFSELPNNKIIITGAKPHLPGWSFLATKSGFNIPDIIVKMMLKQKIKMFNMKKNKKIFIRYSWDIIIDRSEFEKFSCCNEL